MARHLQISLRFQGVHAILWMVLFHSIHFAVVQSLSHVQLFANPWTAALQASLSFTISWSLLKLLSIQPSHPLLLVLLPLIFPSIRDFSNESALHFTSGFEASASASVLLMNIQGLISFRMDWFVSLLSKGLSRVFSNTTVGKRQFFSAQPSLWSNPHTYTWSLEKP